MTPPIRWAMRWLVLRAAVVQLFTGDHVYVSTGCLADRHDYCQQMKGIDGQKRPGRSKFSDAPCVCPCHRS